MHRPLRLLAYKYFQLITYTHDLLQGPPSFWKNLVLPLGC